MYPYLGDYVLGDSITFFFHTFNSSGASVTITGLAVGDIQIYKGSSMTQRASTAGFTLVDTDGIDVDSITGIHAIKIDTGDNTDAGFYANGNDYTVVISTISVDSQTVSFIVGSFSLANRTIRPDGEPQGVVRIPSGTTDQYIYFTAYSSANNKRVTGLSSFTVYRSRNGGSATAYTTPTISEVDATNMPGVYKFLLDEDMSIDAGDYSQEMVLYITGTGMNAVERRIELYRRDIDAPTRGVALSDIPFKMVDSTDHVTPKTGLTITAQVSKDGGAFASAAGTASEIGNGIYQFDATAADMTADVVIFRFTGTGADSSEITIKTGP